MNIMSLRCYKKSPIEGKGAFWKSILFRTIALSWIIIILCLGVFVLALVPFQRQILEDNLTSSSKHIAASISQVTATAIITEDYSSVIDHCLKVIEDRPSIYYVVITRNDGYSLISTAEGWSQGELSGIWTPVKKDEDKGNFIESALINKEVYHYSYHFNCCSTCYT